MTQGPNRSIYEEFCRLVSEPETLAMLTRKAEMEEFRTKYHSIKASPLKCPACSSKGYSGGSLWLQETKDHFVCRRCKLEWVLWCLTTPTEELISKMRQAQKEA